MDHQQKVFETKRIIIYQIGTRPDYWYHDKSNGFNHPYIFSSVEEVKKFLRESVEKTGFMKGWED